MTAPIDRRVLFRSAPNFRDLGGLPVDGGSVARGQVFRSASLGHLDDAELPAFEGLGIGVVFDLRTEGERTSEPDRLPAAVRLIGLDVLADSKADIVAAIGQLRSNPAAVNELLGGGAVQRMLADSYRDIVGLPSARAAYRALFLELADAERSGGALFHCTAGKDRTGWAAASLLMLLGADEQTIHADYLQTNEDLLPALEPVILSAAASGVEPELLRDAFGVRLSYLDTALDELETRFGSAERYFHEGLGLSSATIDALRSRLIA